MATHTPERRSSPESHHETTDQSSDAVDPEPSPSAGYRAVCAILDVAPGLGEPDDPTTRAAIYDESRSRQNRQKHARRISS